MPHESLAESRRRYATIDSDVRIERMMTEKAMGGTKEASLVVRGPVGEALWNRIAANYAAIPEGGMNVYGYRWWADRANEDGDRFRMKVRLGHNLVELDIRGYDTSNGCGLATCRGRAGVTIHLTKQKGHPLVGCRRKLLQ